MLGLLTLDTAFPRIPGDVGAAGTFPFPVRRAVVAGALVDDVVHRADDALFPQFARAAMTLADEGCIGIATTCGFLVRWQRELAAAVPVPVLTSALLQLPLIQRCLPQHRRVGVVTYSETDLTTATLEAAGAPSSTPVAGVDPDGYFASTIRHGADVLDRKRMANDVVAAARRLVSGHENLGAIVLECANMPPYRAAVEAATRLPVFDAVQLITWFYTGIARTPPRYGHTDLW